VRDVGRHVDEIPGSGLGGEFELLAPAHPSATADHVDHAFDGAVVMRTGLRLGMDNDGPRPELLGTRAGVRNRRSTVHSRRLRRVGVELAGAHDTHAVVLPLGSAFHGVNCLSKSARVPATAGYVCRNSSLNAAVAS